MNILRSEQLMDTKILAWNKLLTELNCLLLKPDSIWLASSYANDTQPKINAKNIIFRPRFQIWLYTTTMNMMTCRRQTAYFI